MTYRSASRALVWAALVVLAVQLMLMQVGEFLVSVGRL